MPGGDKTGPLGLGPLSGRGLGLCRGATLIRGGAGLGLGLLLAKRSLGRRLIRTGARHGLGLCPGLGLGLRRLL